MDTISSDSCALPCPENNLRWWKTAGKRMCTGIVVEFTKNRRTKVGVMRRQYGGPLNDAICVEFSFCFKFSLVENLHTFLLL